MTSFVHQITLGDKTMSVLEIWGAEYQENDCLLIKPEDRITLDTICARERCLMQVHPMLIPSVCSLAIAFHHYQTLIIRP